MDVLWHCFLAVPRNLSEKLPWFGKKAKVILPKRNSCNGLSKQQSSNWKHTAIEIKYSKYHFVKSVLFSVEEKNCF